MSPGELNQLAAALLKANRLERVLFAVMQERDALQAQHERLVRSNVKTMAQLAVLT